MTRPAGLYLGLILTLVLAVFIEGRTGFVLLSRQEPLHWQKLWATLAILLAVFFGLLGAQRFEARVVEPWRVPQVQVLLCFALFFVCGALGVLLSS
jgi:hypothetical protein